MFTALLIVFGLAWLLLFVSAVGMSLDCEWGCYVFIAALYVFMLTMVLTAVVAILQINGII